MSLYGKYIWEHRKDEIIEIEDRGFATFRYIENSGIKSVYIVDIYVCADFRNDRIATVMADKICEIAKKNGATELIGTVVPSANNSTDSLRVLLGYGMKLSSASNDLIIFKKEI